jgi:hypothetical protein
LRRRLGIALALGMLLAVPATASAATAPGHMRGIVFARGSAAAHSQALSARTSNLTYHNGPVMHTNATYAIYWIPSGYSVQSGYQSVINGYFSNVAAASGQSSNVYWAGTQYYDGSGNITYSSSFKGAINDTDSFPASGCSDSDTSVCLTDAQLQTEIAHVITANGLPTGLGTEYFLFTPKNVGSCSGTACAFTYFCAYHSNGTVNGQTFLYANMPYAAFVPSACSSGQSPNGNDADATINVTSHEHNETITDPLGTAWYDRSGNEDGDKCAWNFGSPLGGSSGAEYNQVINGAHYYLQQEWSNHSSGCVLKGL